MKKKNSAGVLIPGCLLLGLGIGMFYGRPDVGVLVGLGIGFIAMFVFGKK